MRIRTKVTVCKIVAASGSIDQQTKQKNRPELLHVHFHAVLNANKNENKCPNLLNFLCRMAAI